MRYKNITTRCGSMLNLGMRLPRKAQNKTRTLHVCFVCALMHGCVFGVHNMVVMCCDCLCA